MKKQFDIYVPKYEILNGSIRGKKEVTEKQLYEAIEYEVNSGAYRKVDYICPEPMIINLRTK